MLVAFCTGLLGLMRIRNGWRVRYELRPAAARKNKNRWPFFRRTSGLSVSGAALPLQRLEGDLGAKLGLARDCVPVHAGCRSRGNQIGTSSTERRVRDGIAARLVMCGRSIHLTYAAAQNAAQDVAARIIVVEVKHVEERNLWFDDAPLRKRVKYLAGP